MTLRYKTLYAEAKNDPIGYWQRQAQRVAWSKPHERVLDDSNPPFYRWYPGAELNTCYNALDRHIEAGHGARAALIYDSPVTNTVKSYSYTELREQVAKLAGAIRALGVKKGDRVIIYMAMTPEAVIAMLACARIGAVHSVVFGGFAPRELATRIDDAKPVLMIASSCGLEPGRVVEYKPLLDQAIEIAAHKPQACLVFQRPMCQAAMIAGRDHDYAAAVAAAAPVDCVPVAATDPLYVLYTSGTTGIPKGVVRQNGGHAVALHWSMEHIYGVKPGEVFWAASDVGWVVGHSYIVYAPLIFGATSLLYEGKPVGTPDAGAYWRVIQQHKVVALFTAPTAFRAIKKEDPRGELVKKYDLSHFRALFLAGERADPDTVHWAEDILKKPVIDHWWQTETGWPVSANFMGLELLPVKHGSATCAVPGYDVQVLDDDGKQVPEPGTIGNIAIKLPLPPGCLPTLWNNDEGFKKSYLARFPGYYNTGDAGFIDEDGYIYIMSRTDDIINVAGHRLSTGGMEEVLSAHPDVAECAVVGVADQLKGQVPLGFVVLKSGTSKAEDQIVRELVGLVRDKIGPVAAFKQAVVVKRLPKTRSGKILRGTMQKLADAQEFRMPATIDDPVILTEIEQALQPIGYAKKG
ncbi:propionyl-CoA synthetase [Ferrovibrio sp. MS7]|uniref:propionyl-CoA synthetase n=1 Tax=Ferrovibrio plantarum TaxID=3119164 RepID=UPI003135C69C